MAAAAPFWLDALQRMVDAMPHPILIGCVAVGLGALAFALASPFKSKLDQARRSRNERSRAKVARFRFSYVSLLVAGVLSTSAGTALTISGARADAAVQVKQAQVLLDKTQEENRKARDEYERKIHDVLVALNAAKEEQTRLLTDEKIKGIQKDLLAWVEDFASRKPDKQHQLQQARLAETQKEIQLSQENAPLFTFVLRFVDSAIGTYVKKTGARIQLDLRPFPQNYFDPTINTPARAIVFGPETQWLFSVNASPPADETQSVSMRIHFTSENDRYGNLEISRQPRLGKIYVSATGFLPAPDVTSLSGQYDMEGYEEILGRILQRLIEAQLIDTPSS